MKSKSGREIVGYVVRSGCIPGAGMYACARGTWTDKATASYWGATGREGARFRAEVAKGRVVTLVRREPKPPGLVSEAAERVYGAKPSPNASPELGSRESEELFWGDIPASPGLDDAAAAARAALHGVPVSSWADLSPAYQDHWRFVAEAVRDAWKLVPRAEYDSAVAEGIQLRGEVVRLKALTDQQRARLNTALAAIGHARRILPESV